MATANGDKGESGGISAPYVSFLTVKNTIEKMAREGGVPSQVDRSYLSNVPGSTQTQLIGAMRWLGLIDGETRPTDVLQGLVEGDEVSRKEMLRTILLERYSDATALPSLATQQQLDETFRGLGVSGSTLRKAVGFFLAAAKYVDLPISPHFKTPRAVASTSRPRRPRAGANTQDGSSTPQATGAAMAPQRLQHPLIEGLIQELPTPGAAFPKSKQEDWLQLAKVTFRMIYRTEPEPPDEPQPEPGSGSADDDIPF